MAQDLQNSLTRYVRNNFLDGPKQDAFDLFLGAYLPSTSGVGSSLLFTDRRPLLVQAIPYVLAASVLMVVLSMLSRRLPDSAIWPMRLFLLFWFVIGSWSLNFIYGHGMLYVSVSEAFPRRHELTKCLGELAQTQHASMGSGRLPRRSHARASGQACWAIHYGEQTAARTVERPDGPHGRGQEEDRIMLFEAVDLGQM